MNTYTPEFQDFMEAQKAIVVYLDRESKHILTSLPNRLVTLKHPIYAASQTLESLDIVDL